jgi:hypothetical protein
LGAAVRLAEKFRFHVEKYEPAVLTMKKARAEMHISAEGKLVIEPYTPEPELLTDSAYVR